MRLNLLSITWVFVLAVTLSSARGGVISQELLSDHGETRVNENLEVRENRQRPNGTRQDEDGVDPDTEEHVDPYLAKSNEKCRISGYGECVKARVLKIFSDLLDRNQYVLTDNIKLVRMPKDVVQEVNREPSEFVGSSRADDSEWDQFVKFIIMRLEKFIKTLALKIKLPPWVTGEKETYAPRFADEIANEIDVLDNKKDTPFSRNQLKILLIPMLVVLKLFKLKLFLLLVIFGLGSVKKLLAFLTLVVPGVVGLLKLYKPLANSYTPPVYSSSGIGFPDGENKINTEEDSTLSQELAYRGHR